MTGPGKQRSRRPSIAGVLALACLCLVAACGGSGGGGGQGVAPAPPGPAASPDFSTVKATIDRFSVPDVAIVIGDANGAIYRYQRGSMAADRPVYIASASKLLLGLSAWLLVEDATLSPSTRAEALIDFWARQPTDERSRVTLEQLFAFTSGFNGTAEQASCIGDAGFSLRDCVRQIHDGGLDTLPGESFNYGNEHMQIAALMMINARNQGIDTIMRQRLLDPLGVSRETRYSQGSGDNPTYSGGMRSTGDDYGRVLGAVLKGDILKDRAGFLADRVGARPTATVPNAISANRLSWHYGWGFWKECAGAAYVAACDAAPIISSAGAFGFTPWIDFGRGYWAVIVMEEPLNRGYDPAQLSLALEQQLQPQIAAALGR